MKNLKYLVFMATPLLLFSCKDMNSDKNRENNRQQMQRDIDRQRMERDKDVQKTEKDTMILEESSFSPRV